MLKKYIIKQLFNKLEKIEHGTLSITMPDSKEYIFESENPLPKCKVIIHDTRVITNLLLKGDIGFAESYRDNLFETDDLVNLIDLTLKNSILFENYMYTGLIKNLSSRILYFLRLNTVRGSRKNIQAHYDLGNDFYSLWLDKGMTYSSGIFTNENDSLEQAQKNKYTRILDRLDKKSGSLLEIGCGWGGFAEAATQYGDYDLKGITISQQQHAFASVRLQNKATIALEDYRKQEGKYDHIISIEMFEAIGEKYWITYFQAIKNLLNKGGKAIIQTITIDEAHFKQYEKSGDPIRTFIFPGGMLPSVERFQECAAKAGLQVTNTFAFAESYTKTLKLWLEQFNKNIIDVKALNFDDAFIRIWRFYLAACISSFTTQRTNVMQIELIHSN